jgi:hypothetical protein
MATLKELIGYAFNAIFFGFMLLWCIFYTLENYVWAPKRRAEMRRLMLKKEHGDSDGSTFEVESSGLEQPPLRTASSVAVGARGANR